MNNKYTNFIFLACLIILFQSCKNNEIKGVEIRCRYQMYACGDCFPQYKVLEVKNVAPDIEKKIIGLDIFIFEKMNINKNILEGEVCLICFDIYAIGNLRKERRGYVLYAESVEKQLIPDCCD
jgi:hypothetical protein